VRTPQLENCTDGEFIIDKDIDSYLDLKIAKKSDVFLAIFNQFQSSSTGSS
jgi:hypothetical protein